MDVSNAAAKDSAMIALLPTTTDWCRQELPHMTLVYAGIIDNLPVTQFNEMAKDAAAIAMLTRPITLEVIEVKEFGDVEKVNALNLRATPEIVSMRRMVEHWNASEFPFDAHATIGPVGQVVQNVPRFLSFDKIMCAWGDEQLTFQFK